MFWYFILLFIIVCAVASFYFRFRDIPFWVNGKANDTFRVPVSRIQFIYSLSWKQNGKVKVEPRIYDCIFKMIKGAKTFILLDIFLFNLHHIRNRNFPPVTEWIADTLSQKKIPRLFITDPVNDFYGTVPCKPLQWLKKGGTKICITNVDYLRDNNLIFSGFWRLFLSPWGTKGKGWIPFPLMPEYKTNLRAILKAVNGRGNHRKVIITQLNHHYATLISSSNFYNAGCYFANTGFLIKDNNIASIFLEAEKEIARMSEISFKHHIPPAEEEGEALVTPLMGERTKSSLIEDIHHTSDGDRIDIAMLFLSDFDVIDALVSAAQKGVKIRAILDKNEVSFGNEKRGFPNRFSAWRIHQRCPAIEIRWANSFEEFHSKLVYFTKKGKSIAWCGSANICRKSLSDTNLEANVRIEMPLNSPLAADIKQYFERISKEPYSLPYEEYTPSFFYYLVFLFEEKTGMSTF